MAFVGFLSSSGAAIFKLHVDVGLGLRQILPFFYFFLYCVSYVVRKFPAENWVATRECTR